jgi:hypothetical protein
MNCPLKNEDFNIGRQFVLRTGFGDLQMAFTQSQFALHCLTLYTNIHRILQFLPKRFIRPFFLLVPSQTQFYPHMLIAKFVVCVVQICFYCPNLLFLLSKFIVCVVQICCLCCPNLLFVLSKFVVLSRFVVCVVEICCLCCFVRYS